MPRIRPLLLSLFAVSGAHAADPWRATTQKLDAYFDALETNQLANGNIVISERGEVRYRRSVGSAVIDARGNEPNDATTRFKVGPVSMLFTAILAMQLAESASITLDGPVAEFYPDLPNALTLTYRDLLRHRSGLADYSSDPAFERWRTRPRTPAEMLALITAAGSKFPPGERVDYGNSNYLVMGYVIEKVYEKPYADVVRRQIVDKLGLPRTYYGKLASPGNHEALSYEFGHTGWVADAQTDPNLHGGAGGMISNAEDLVRLIEALYSGRLVTPTSLATMQNQDGGSGIGLWPHDVAGHRGFGHGGAIEGYRACVYYFPDRRIAIAFTGNAQVLAVSEIIDEALTTIFDRRHVPPGA